MDLFSDNFEKFIMFLSNGRKFAIHISDVKSIFSPKEIYEIPEFPYYFLGTANVDGQMIPIIDVNARFKFHQHSISDKSCVIISFAKNDDKVFNIGLLVDEILDIVEVEPGRIEPCRAISSEAYTRYLKSVFSIHGEPCYVVSPD